MNQFTTALQKVMVDALMVASTRKNCKDDLDAFVFGFQSVSSASAQQTNVLSDPSPGVDQIDVSMPSLLNIQQANVLAYIAGYICRRIGPKLCSGCAQSLGSVSNHAHHMFISVKSYSCETSLLEPSPHIMQLCQQLEKTYTAVSDLPLLLILSVYTDFLPSEFGKIQIFFLEIWQNTDFFQE